MSNMKSCSKCNIILTDENWRKNDKIRHHKLCMECSREYHRNAYNKWAKKHPDIRAKQIYRNVHKMRNRIIELLGEKCVCNYNNCWHSPNICPIIDKRLFHIDHIKGGGSEELRKFPNSAIRYRVILKSIESNENKYQLLCANCNWLKRYYNNETN